MQSIVRAIVILFFGLVSSGVQGAYDQDVLVAAGGVVITLSAATLQWWHLYKKTNEQIRAEALEVLSRFDNATLQQKIWGYHDVLYYSES